MAVKGNLERVRRHLANPDSYHRRIATGFAWVGLFVFASKLAGAAKEMAIAWRYGVSETADAYVLIFNLVNWPVGVWFSVLGLVLVPLIARLRLSNTGALEDFGREMFGLSLLAALILGAISYPVMDFFLDSGLMGLAATVQAEALRMAGPLSLLLPLGILTSLLSAWVMGYGRHANSVLEGVPAVVLLVVLLAPEDWVPRPLVWGSIGGALVHLFCLTVWLRGMGLLPRPLLACRSAIWEQFWGGMAMIGIGQALMSVTSILDQLFAARLGAGAIATFNYASRLVALVLALGATAIGRSTVPIFADMVVSQAASNLRALAVRWASWMFVVGLVAAAAGWYGAPLFVKLLFERGAFTPNDTLNVVEVLRYALIQLPFFFAGTVLVSLLAARGEYRTIAVIACANVLVKVTAILALVPLMGLNAIAFSATLMYAATLAFFAYFVTGAKQ